ncbi:YesL family protein [Neobacillus drentensis]|uniref:YesL family protein n=1 Tax=Neobacillus drentensis TaxID=220684 RepID=UPI002FFD9624
MGKTYANKLYQLCEWILRLAYLNLLWVLFTLSGLILFGLFPATTAAFAVTRKWVNGEQDSSVFRTFVSSFKMEFWKSQVLGFLFVCTGFVLYLYVVFFNSQSSIISTGLKTFTIILSVVYLMTLVFIFPVFVHYKMSFYEYIKNTLFVSMLNPIASIFSLSGLLLMGVIMVKFPGLIPFFSISGPVLWITINTQKAFKKIEAKRVNVESTVLSD